MSARSVTLRGQAAAERIMVDACTITTPDPDGTPVWNDTDGVWADPAPLTIYSGKCRVRQPNTGGNEADAGETTFNVSDRIVSIPLAGTGYADGVVGVPVGATVTITAVSEVGDPAMSGKAFTYLSPASQQTHPTARRMRCKEVD